MCCIVIDSYKFQLSCIPQYPSHVFHSSWESNNSVYHATIHIICKTIVTCPIDHLRVKSHRELVVWWQQLHLLSVSKPDCYEMKQTWRHKPARILYVSFYWKKESGDHFEAFLRHLLSPHILERVLLTSIPGPGKVSRNIYGTKSLF